MEAQGCPVTNGCCVSQAELLQSVVGQGPEVAPEHVHEEAVDAPRPVAVAGPPPAPPQGKLGPGHAQALGSL